MAENKKFHEQGEESELESVAKDLLEKVEEAFEDDDGDRTELTSWVRLINRARELFGSEALTEEEIR